jgi:hypothetical protein
VGAVKFMLDDSLNSIGLRSGDDLTQLVSGVWIQLNWIEEVGRLNSIGSRSWDLTQLV